MKLRYWIPQFLKDHLRLMQLRKAHPSSIINTSLIADNVSIGQKCALAINVNIAGGVTIGDHSYVNPGTMIGSGFIGKYCSIAPGCLIGMPEHPIDFISTSPHTYDEGNVFGMAACWDSVTQPPRIGNDVWIGGNSVIIQGVRIADGAIIAAGAVVTKDVPPYAVVGGIPAKILRYRFPKEIVSYLLDWKWWDLSESELLKHNDLFANGGGWVDVCAQRTGTK